MIASFFARIPVCVILCGLAFLPDGAHAAYPDRPVHMLVGTPAGGGNDFVARTLAGKLAEMWGQPVIIENRPGADGTMAEDRLAHTIADGYTILLTYNTHTVAPSQMALTYDPIKSFAPVVFLEQHPDLLVINPSTVPVNSLREFIAYVKARPGQLNFGSGGVNAPPYLEIAVLLNRTGMNMVSVLYKGMGPAVVGLLGGEVHVLSASVATVGEQVKAGKFKALATTGTFRLPEQPDVPTVAEAADLPGYNEGSWEGILAPAGTPPEIVRKLHDDIVDAMNAPDVRETFRKTSYFPRTGTSEAFAQFIRDDLAKWNALLKAK